MALGSFSSCTIVLVLSNNETQLEDPIPTHGNQEQPMQCSTTHAQGQRTGIHSAGKQGRQKECRDGGSEQDEPFKEGSETIVDLSLTFDLPYEWSISHGGVNLISL